MSTILNLEETANLLHMSSEGLRRMAKIGAIPAFKAGKRWIFIKEDIVEFVRANYSPKSVKKTNPNSKGDVRCLYTKEKIQKYGGSISRRQMEKEYENLLGLRTKKKPRNTMTERSLMYGGKVN